MSFKTYPKCQIEKTISEFSKDSSKKSGVRSQCKKCCGEISKTWKQKNPQRNALHSKRWRSKNGIRHREYSKNWYRTNRNMALEREKRRYRSDSTRIKNRVKTWRSNNKVRIGQYEHRRRAAKMNNGVFVILQKELTRLKMSNCAQCGSKQNVTFDHIIPISRGGRHSVGNLQPLCLSCNASKQDKLMIEWRVRRFA